MQLLEYFYNRNNSLMGFYPRKFTIPKMEQILIYGSPSSGKSYLVLNYLMEFESEKTLYIDFADPKFQFKAINSLNLKRFVELNSIDILVFDHYPHGYFETFPKVKQLIIVSDRLYDYGFKSMQIHLLDYEEFFSFQKHHSEKQIFNLFLKLGTFPQLATQTIPKEQMFKLLLQSHFTQSEQKLLSILAHFNGSVVTTFQLYCYAKERYKISKDLIYRQIKDLTERGVIIFIQDAIYTRNKKLLFFDFALAKYLTLTQKFPKQFESMIALSLLKHKIKFKSFGVMGYITERENLILPAPFESMESSQKRANSKFELYRKSGIKRVEIITVATNYSFKVEEMEFEAIPFYEWVIINGESSI